MRKNNIHPRLEVLSTIPVGSTGDVERDEFSKRPCDCCGNHLAGARYFVKAIRKGRRRANWISRHIEGGKAWRSCSVVMRPTFAVCTDCMEVWQ
jgi:hypothetical protein